MPCSEMADQMVAVLDGRIDREPLPELAKTIEKVAARIALTPVTFVLRLGRGTGKVASRYEGAFQGQHPVMRNQQELRQEINAATMDFVEAGGDLAVVVPLVRVTGRFGAEAFTGIFRREIVGLTDEGFALGADAASVAPRRGVGRGNQMPFANTAEDLVSTHTGVPLNRAGQTISGSGPGGVRVPDFPVRGPQSSIRLRGAVMEVKASHLKNFGDLSSRSRAQILDAVGYARRLRARSGMVRDPQIRTILENAHVEVFSDLAAPTRGRFYRLVEQGLIKWSPIPR